MSDLRVKAPYIDVIIQDAEDLVAHPRNDEERERTPKVNTTLTRWRTIPREQQRFMGVVQRFLRRTLVILTLAIIGLVLANMLNTWVVTRWLLGVLIILAGVRLWRDTASVMREAARSIQAIPCILAASPFRFVTGSSSTTSRWPASSGWQGPVVLSQPFTAGWQTASLVSPCVDILGTLGTGGAAGLLTMVLIKWHSARVYRPQMVKMQRELFERAALMVVHEGRTPA